METTQTTVQRRPKRYWTAEKKLGILEEWRNGIPTEELCRRYGIAASQISKWKRDLEQGLKERGEMVPKSQVAGLQKKVEELESALGRKTMEVDVLKKIYEIKGLKLPDGL